MKCASGSKDSNTNDKQHGFQLLGETSGAKIIIYGALFPIQLRILMRKLTSRVVTKKSLIGPAIELPLDSNNHATPLATKQE